MQADFQHFAVNLSPSAVMSTSLMQHAISPLPPLPLVSCYLAVKSPSGRNYVTSYSK